MALKQKNSPHFPAINEPIGSKVKNPNRVHRESLTPLEELAMWITDRVGTMGFFFILFFWTLIWFGWNILAPAANHFDPYPDFVWWLLVCNVIQIFLLPLIIAGQNLQNRHAEYRAEADYRVNVQAESEIQNIMHTLEKNNEILTVILNHAQSTNHSKKQK